MAKVKDALETRGPNKQESSLGAVKAGPAKTVKGQPKGGGVTWAEQSSNLPDRPIRVRTGGNQYKGKPGAA